MYIHYMYIYICYINYIYICYIYYIYIIFYKYIYIYISAGLSLLRGWRKSTPVAKSLLIHPAPGTISYPIKDYFPSY